MNQDNAPPKPIVFFSHSSRDKKPLADLKELFCEKTSGTIDVFLSSDGQSIPLGRNWVYRIEQALTTAKLMFAFLTPYSLRSDWLFFETGYAYAKRIRVVPVGFLGVDLSSVPPPLGLLQGFNITSKDGLDNIVATTNQVFGYSHRLRFSEAEYEKLARSAGESSALALGEYSWLVDGISISLSSERGLAVAPGEALRLTREILAADKVSFKEMSDGLRSYGIAVNVRGSQLAIAIDQSVAAVTLPLVERILKATRTNGVEGVSAYIRFGPGVLRLVNPVKLSARIYGTEIQLGEGSRYVYKDLEFGFVAGLRKVDADHPPTMSVRFASNSIPVDQLRMLLKLLIDLDILYVE